MMVMAVSGIGVAVQCFRGELVRVVTPIGTPSPLRLYIFGFNPAAKYRRKNFTSQAVSITVASSIQRVVVGDVCAFQAL